MSDDHYAQILHALTKYDQRQARGKHYNRYALAHYAEAMGRVRRYTLAGHDLRSAVITCYLGRLCDVILKALGLELMTRDECRIGLAKPLPRID